MIVFRHHRDTLNIGDRVCSPYDYFPDLAERGVALDFKDPVPPCDAVIYGGGKVLGGLYAQLQEADRLAKHRIAWGVSTVQRFPISLRYFRSRQHLTLIGSRDWGDRNFTFAPCVTCMSPLFDKTYSEEHEYVFYGHGWRTERMGIKVPDSMPYLSNKDSGSLEESLDFIGSGKTVISNSYHGTYWALLMGKRVLCLPFSNKFHNYRFAPGYATPANWLAKLDAAISADEMLETCREATEKFHAQVCDVLGIEGK